MIAIADAGGSKTEWRIISESGISQFFSEGFNSISDPIDGLQSTIPKGLKDLTISTLHYYGAGVNPVNQPILRESLMDLVQAEKIAVYPDTLGVARGLWGDQSGWVGILGTGSAAFHYNGIEINERIPSLGYHLGDEGSGMDIGRTFVKTYLRGHFSELLTEKIKNNFPDLNETNALNEVYKEHKLKPFLNQFTEFISKNQTEKALYQLVYQCFEGYFNQYFAEQKLSELSFSGSVAFHFSNILTAVARTRSIRINRIIQSPIAGLTLYHQSHG